MYELIIDCQVKESFMGGKVVTGILSCVLKVKERVFDLEGNSWKTL